MSFLELTEKLVRELNPCDRVSRSVMNPRWIKRKGKERHRLPGDPAVGGVSEEKTNRSNKNIEPWEIQNVQRAGCSSFLSVAVIKISERKQLRR